MTAGAFSFRPLCDQGMPLFVLSHKLPPTPLPRPKVNKGIELFNRERRAPGGVSDRGLISFTCVNCLVSEGANCIDLKGK